MTDLLTGLLTNPMVLVAVVSSLVSGSALVLRTALVEVRWWLALRDTAPAARPEIIRALHRPARVGVGVRAATGAGRGGGCRREE